MTKIQIIKTQLYEMILSDQFPGGKLPGERELAVRLQAGRNTIRTILQELSEKGLIERHRKKGTIILNSRGNPDKKLAGLVMRTAKQPYADCYHCLLTEFVAAGYSVQSVSTSPISEYVWKPNKMIAKAIEKLLKSDPEILVVDGYVSGRIPQIEEIRRRSPIMIDFYDSSRDRDFTGVWFDYCKAGYLAGKYLIDKGCRKPVLFSSFVPPRVRFNPEAYGHHRAKRIIEGFRQAMAEGGIDPENAVISSSAVRLQDHYSILDHLTSQPSCMPDGFCGALDKLTVKFIKSFQENRGKVPDNMALVGIGNTSLSRESSIYPFASVDLQPKILAQAIVQQSQLEPKKRHDIFIEPILIERDEKKRENE